MHNKKGDSEKAFSQPASTPLTPSSHPALNRHPLYCVSVHVWGV